MTADHSGRFDRKRAAERSFSARAALLRLGAFLLLLAVGVLVSNGVLLQRPPLYDEAIYEAAAERFRDGESPYGVDDFYYPPFFVLAVDRARALAGEQLARWAWRWASFLALLWIVWLSGTWAVPEDRVGAIGARLAIAGLLLSTPAAATVLQFGNMSALVGALILGGLLAADSRPVAAGLLLSASFGIKPLVIPAFGVLGAPSRESRASRWLRSPPLVAALAGAVTSSILLLALPYWTTYIRTPIRDDLFHRSASLLRLLDLLSIPIPRVIVILAVSGCFALVVWWRRAQGRERTVWALTAIVVGAPLLWDHTFLLLYPVLALALRVAFRCSLEKRRRVASKVSRFPWWADAAVVSCLVAVILFFESANLDLLPNWIQVASILPPLVSPVLLASYVAVMTGDAAAAPGSVG